MRDVAMLEGDDGWMEESNPNLTVEWQPRPD